MFNNPTVAKLHEMKLKVMAQMVNEPDAAQRDLSFDERLGIMVERQWLEKKNARIQRNLRSASFSMPAQLENLDFTADRTIDKPLIRTLSSCLYIEQKLNIVVSGKTGSGKSFLISALGDAACRKEFSVRYFRIPELLLEIEEAKATNRYTKFMKSMGKVNLLILDDLGIKTYSLEESRDILELTESRYNKSSTILSGQVPHTQWYDLFPNPTIADAIMDRVIHNAYILVLNSKKSMREIVAEKTFQSLEKLG